MSHINLFDLNLSLLKIAKCGRMVKLVYNKEPLQLVTEKMYTPFGVKVNTNNYSSFTNCHLDSSLNQSSSEVSVKYGKALESLDARIIELLKESEHLFTNTESTIEDIETIYSPILRPNKTYPKLMKISLPRDTKGNFEFVVFNELRQKVQITDSNIEEILCKGTVFKGIIESGKVWYYNGRFGTTWNLKQMKFSEQTTAVNTHSENPENYQSIMIIDD